MSKVKPQNHTDSMLEYLLNFNQNQPIKFRHKWIAPKQLEKILLLSQTDFTDAPTEQLKGESDE